MISTHSFVFFPPTTVALPPCFWLNGVPFRQRANLTRTTLRWSSWSWTTPGQNLRTRDPKRYFSREKQQKWRSGSGLDLNKQWSPLEPDWTRLSSHWAFCFCGVQRSCTDSGRCPSFTPFAISPCPRKEKKTTLLTHFKHSRSENRDEIEEFPECWEITMTFANKKKATC